MGVLPERICCITYTKAAASEMRHRVLKQLRELLLMDDTACAKKVSDLLCDVATDADVACARSLFGAVLDSACGGLQLTTIHGFCQTILKRFPLEAGINPHFTVLEETAADKLLITAKHRLLNFYQKDDPALNTALEIIGSRASEARFDVYISHIISKRGHWESLWRSQSPSTLQQRIMALHGLESFATVELLMAEFVQCIGTADASTIRTHLAQLVSHEKSAEQKMGRILAAWLEVEPEFRITLVDEFCLLFLTKEGEIRKTLLNKKEFPEGAPLRQVIEALAMRAYAFEQQRAALACAEESYAVAILARALLELYAQAKEASHALDYDDLIGKTRQLFANPAMLGWVMSKLDHRIDHLLIDEAQDTSGEQWSITQLLVEELIAANDGVGSGNIPRSLLVVGDEKQSIYSFQGAAPELFARMNTQFHAALDESFSPLENETLANSYRSAQAILALVDQLATAPEFAKSLSAAGVTHPHRLTRTDAIGSVTLYPTILAPERVATEALTIPMEYQISQSAAQQLSDQVAETIKGWLTSGRMLENEGRAVNAGDILILVRSRKPLVLPLIRALERRDVPVAGLDRLTLSEHLAVRDLLALMRVVINPADDLSLAQVLRSPLIGMSDEALCTLCVGRSGPLWSVLGGHLLLDHARDMSNATPYDFLTEVLEVRLTRSVFAERFGEEVHEVLDELKAQAAAMPEGTAPTLANFYDWISGSKRQIKREQETGQGNQVRIMTVHGAKGLEAPIVLLVDTVNVPTTQHEVLYFMRNLQHQTLPLLAISEEAKAAPTLARVKQEKADALIAEYNRLLYVALTRARDELHIWGTASKKGMVNERSWYATVERAMQALDAQHEGEMVVLRNAGVAAQQANDNIKIQSAQRPEWINLAAPKIIASTRSVAPSQLVTETGVSPYAQSGGTAMRERGVRIHRILELLTAESDAATITRLTKLVAPEWDEKERASITKEVVLLLTQERWIWESKSHAEVNICGNIMIGDASLSVGGQIDRLIEMTTEVVILDYKTGRHIPKTANQIPENYRIQLKTYHALVRQLYPHKLVRCAIVWTAAPSLMWCDEVVGATEWKIPVAL
jgi:ATP-dependent helicase/nuclease subunit A